MIFTFLECLYCFELEMSHFYKCSTASIDKRVSEENTKYPRGNDSENTSLICSRLNWRNIETSKLYFQRINQLPKERKMMPDELKFLS